MYYLSIILHRGLQTNGQSDAYEIPFGHIKLIIPNIEKARDVLLGGEFKEVADKLTVLSKLVEDDIVSNDGALAER